MWAGIWIEDNLADAAHYLRAIAEDRPSATPPPPATSTASNPRGNPWSSLARANHSVAAVITARSSGHCEILAPGCGLALDTIASRLPTVAAGTARRGRRLRGLPKLSGGGHRMEPRLRRRLGYTVDSLAAAHRPVLLAPKPLDAFGSGGRGGTVLIGSARRMRPGPPLRHVQVVLPPPGRKALWPTSA